MRRTFTAPRHLASLWLVCLACLSVQLLPLARLQAAPLAELGDYEREAVEEVLARYHLTIDPRPEGKKIDRVRIVNLDVFDRSTGLLQKLNTLHRTTEPGAIESELLNRPGDRWRDAQIRETERILRDPTLSSLAVIVPLGSAADDAVEMLVVTRDVWSLRSNSAFTHQDGSFSYLSIAAAENNLLGRRKHVSLIFEMDQGEYSVSPNWRDRNVLGKRWQLLLRPRLIFGRKNHAFEGTQSLIRVEYPLWSLATPWGFSVEASHKRAIARAFAGNALATYDDPDTEEIEDIPQEFRRADFALRTQVSRSLGHDFKKIITLGHRLESTRPRLLEAAELSPSTAENFARDLFPRDERSSALILSLDVFEARYVTYRNLDGYDLPEVYQVGLNLSAESALALRAFGSERSFARNLLHASYALDIDARAIARVGVTLGRRFEKRGGLIDAVDTTYGADWYLASPHLGGYRLVAFGEASLRADVLDNELVRIGGQDDLRGYSVGQFIGTSFYRASVELRSMPRELAFMRVGYVVFYDIGGAANRAKRIGAHQDVGLGIKALIPQTGESLLFLYWALPFDRDARSFPGRISIGFGKEL